MLKLIRLLYVLPFALLLAACTVQTEVPREMAGLQGAPDPGGIPCEGEISYSTCYTVTSEGGLTNGNYQYVIDIDTSYSPRGPQGCKCDELHFCIVFRIPNGVLGEVSQGNRIQPVAEFSTSILEQVDSDDPVARGNSASNIRRICVSKDELVAFSLNMQSDPTFDFHNSIIAVHGLCIIYDVPTPRIHDYDEFPCQF